jgi:hypothetical protein
LRLVILLGLTDLDFFAGFAIAEVPLLKPLVLPGGTIA